MPDTTYAYTVSAYDNALNESAQSSPVDVTTLLATNALIRVNAGGGAYTDGSGNLWSADYGYNTGLTAGFSNPISGTNDDLLYQSQRYDKDTSPELIYSFNVPNGDYTVNLHFAEIYSGTFGVGLRVFDVLIEGQVVASNLDIYSEVGANAALVKSYAVTVSDGQLNIEFRHVVENPEINAIEVISSTGGGDTVPPSTPTGLTGNAVSSTQIDLSWNASTDTGGSGLAGYKVYRGGVQVGITTLTSFSDTGLNPNTTYSYTVSAYDTAQNESAQTSPVNVTTSSAMTLIRVNAGGGAYTDGNGNVWSADYGYNTGNAFSTTNAISVTTDGVLYQSQRYDPSASPELIYSFTVPNGTYVVNLHFAETYSGAFGVGKRVFDVLIEGQVVTSGLDIYSQVGPNAALMKSYAVTVSDGQLNIEFHHVVENPEINAIEVIPTASALLPILENFNNGNANNWKTVDNTPYPAAWQVIGDQYYQQNFDGLDDTMVGAYHLGTYAFLATGLNLTNYRVTATLTPLPSTIGHQVTNDIGIMFRYHDDYNYYRLSFNSAYGFMRFEKRYRGQFTTLAENAIGYDGLPLQVTIEVTGDLIEIYVNGDPLFSVSDSDILSGTIALYSQDESKFDDVLIDNVSPDPSIVISKPESYSIDTTGTLDASAIVTNMPLNGSVEFVLYDDSMTVVDSAVVSNFPYTAQFSGLSQGEHTLEAILRDGSDTEVARDTNVVIGVLGDYYFAVGDSITNGYHNNITNNSSQDQRIYSIQGGFESTLNDLLTNTSGYPNIIFNEGVPGDESVDAADTRIDSIIERHPGANLALILLGTNDALALVPSGQGCSGTLCDGTFNGNMQTLLDKVVAQAGKTAFVALVPPIFTSPADPLSSTTNSYVQLYNSVLTGLINNLPNVEPGPDFFTFFLGSGTYQNLFSLFSDALHPNALGYLVMAYLWRKAITGIGGPPFILNNLSLSTVAPFLKQNLLETGNKYYVDESYTLTNIPSGLGLANGRWIMTANSDVGNTDSVYVSFDVDRSVTVYVAYDLGAAIPDWLSSSNGFNFTGSQLSTSNPSVPTMNLYSKTYTTAGTISLGGNQADGATGAANYIVIVVEN